MKKILVLMMVGWLGSMSAFASNSTTYEITALNGHQLSKEEQQEVQQELTTLKIKAENGDIQAMNGLAEIYLYGADEEKAVYWTHQLAEKVGSVAFYQLAGAYEMGWFDGFKRDEKKAYDYYLKMANDNKTSAQLWLADYYNGWRKLDGGVCKCGKRDFQKALDWATKAHNQGDNKASGLIADLYRDDTDGNRDLTKAIEWYQISIEQNQKIMDDKGEGDTSAEVQGARLALHHSYFWLGNIYDELEDYDKAMYYYQQDINMPVVSYASSSYYQVGQMYEHGLGVKKDVNEAKVYYKKACQEGISEACDLK